MKNAIRYILISIIAASLFTSCGFEELDGVYNHEITTSYGDDMSFADPDFDDSEWNWYLAESKINEIFWVRLKLDLSDLKSKSNLAIRMTSTANYELYFDGHYMNTNGSFPLKPGKTNFEEGKYIHFTNLQDSLLEGDHHVIALRCISNHDHIGHHSFALVGNYYQLTTRTLKVSLFMMFFGGMFLLTGMLFLFLYFFNWKDQSLLLFSLISIVFFALLMMEYLKLFYHYEYSFQHTRLWVIAALHTVLCFLVPGFFAYRFKFPWWKIIFVLLTLGIFIINYKIENIGWDGRALYTNKMMWVASFITIIYACIKKMREGFIVLIGFAVSMLVFFIVPTFKTQFVSSFDISAFLCFTCIVFSMLYVLVYQRNLERIAYQGSLVTSERLKNELLKKNIKPHFIMNTLTSLIDWVEDSPKEGVKFIHALADEFDALNEIADHKLVPISQEIRLCKNLLRVMGYRKEIKYTWIQNGIDENEILPPATLHTAVENAISHMKPNEDGEMVFKLSFQKDQGYKEYQLLVKGKINQNISTNTSTNENIGTGTKYIHSRLKESYGDRWTYTSKRVDEGWLTIIRITT